MRSVKHLFSLVEDWRTKFGLKTFDKESAFVIPSKEDLDLNIRLIKEEYNEYLEAVKNNNIVKIADGLGDLFFVLVQYFDGFNLDSHNIYKHSLFHGYHKEKLSFDNKINNLINNDVFKIPILLDLGALLFEEIFYQFEVRNLDIDKIITAVYDSNLTKSCKTKEEAKEKVKNYKKEEIEAYIFQYENYFIVKRKSDNKVLKSINYKEPDLSFL